jgi:hypothetical protein
MSKSRVSKLHDMLEGRQRQASRASADAAIKACLDLFLLKQAMKQKEMIERVCRQQALRAEEPVKRNPSQSVHHPRMPS